MMKFCLLFLMIPLAIATQQCSRPNRAAQHTSTELYGRWFNSYEEDNGTAQVYRREGFQFPMSRGRTGFALLKEGVFEQFDIAPADGLEKTTGTWRISSEQVVEVNLTNASEGRNPKYRFQIVSLDKDKLVIKRLAE